MTSFKIKDAIYLSNSKKISRLNILFFRIIQNTYKSMSRVFDKLYLTLLQNE